MQDWMILVLAIAVLGVAFIVVARDKPTEREFLPDDDPWYGGGTGSGDGEPLDTLQRPIGMRDPDSTTRDPRE